MMGLQSHRGSEGQSRRHQGFSLVELLLALVLGLIVVSGVVQLFVSNSRTYSTLNGQARMQENARFALDLISRATRSAGYFSCDRAMDTFGWGLSTAPDALPEFDIRRPAWGYNTGAGAGAELYSAANFWRANPLAAAADELASGTDILVVRSARDPQAYLSEILQPVGPDIDAKILWSSTSDTIAADDVLVFGACDQASVVAASAAVPGATAGSQVISIRAGANGNSSQLVPVGGGDAIAFGLSLSGRSFGSDAIVSPLESVFFFIREGSGWAINTDGSGYHPLALWEKRGTAAPAELIQGIEDLQLLFGVDGDLLDGVTSVSRYLPPEDLDGLAEPRAIVAVRVMVTANSIDAVDGELLRRSYTQTIQIRNANPER